MVSGAQLHVGSVQDDMACPSSLVEDSRKILFRAGRAACAGLRLHARPGSGRRCCGAAPQTDCAHAKELSYPEHREHGSLAVDVDWTDFVHDHSSQLFDLARHARYEGGWFESATRPYLSKDELRLAKRG